MNGKINNISFYIGIMDHQNNHIRISELQNIRTAEYQYIRMSEYWNDRVGSGWGEWEWGCFWNTLSGTMQVLFTKQNSCLWGGRREKSGPGTPTAPQKKYT